MKRVICVPIYKLRRNDLIVRLMTSKYCTYLFTSPDDETDYTDITNNNVSIVKTDANNIAEKHQYILDWCRQNNVDQFIELDDDVKPQFLKITPETKRKTSDSYSNIKIDCDEFFDALFNSLDINDAGFTSVIRSTYLGFSRPGKVSLNKTLNCGQVIGVDIKRTMSINYITDKFINDDVCFCMDCLMNGINCVTLGDYSFTQYNDKSVITETNNLRSFMQMNTAEKYHFPIYLDKQNVVRFKIKFDKYFNDKNIPEAKDEFNKTVYEMINKNIDKQEIYNYIFEHYNNKN